MLRLENEGITGGTEEEFNLDRQIATQNGVEIWGLLHGVGLARIEQYFGTAMSEVFELVHELGGPRDYREDLTERELHRSFEECPDAWFYIFYKCRKQGIRNPLVDKFYSACKQLVIEGVLPDLRDLMTAYVEAEEFEQVEVTEAQHRKAAIVVGITTDLLRRMLGTRLAEVNELQKQACMADHRPSATKRRAAQG